MLFFLIIFIYLFFFGCTGASLLCQLFSHCSKRGILSSCGSWASHCRAWALGQVAAAAAKSLQSCPTLYDPIDSSPPCSPVPGILQARTLEWVAISFSSAWKRKVKVKPLSRVQLYGLQPTRLLHSWDFPGKSTGVGCHCLAIENASNNFNILTIRLLKNWPGGQQISVKCIHHYFTV